MRSRLLDLETFGLDEANTWFDPCEPDAALLEPILPDSRLKDPAKVAANLADVARRIAERPAEIAANIAAKEAERMERFALDADTCRVVAFGWHDLPGGQATVALCSTDREEREQLQLFWKSYAEQSTRLIGFNIFRFDLPVLVMRSLYLNVAHPAIEFAPAWKAWPHVDLWDKLSLNGARRDVKSLRFYAKRFGIPIYDDISGKDVAAMVKAGEWSKVENHCLFDLDLTRALAERLGVLTPLGVAA